MIYECNNVTLDGGLDLSFSENVEQRFLASEWNVIKVADGNDLEAIDKALSEAKLSQDKPTIIIVKTIIGYGSEKQGTIKVHGNPLGEEDRKHAKEVYNYNYPAFEIPEVVYKHFEETFANRGFEHLENWSKVYAAWPKENKEEVHILENAIAGNVD